MKYRKRPIVIEASQWWQNGDHPLDYSKRYDEFEYCCLRQLPPDERKAAGWEGDVVRYFRNPDKTDERQCEKCGQIMRLHGWIDTLEGGHIVCPGDWIITGVAGEFYPCKSDIFEATYERVTDDERTDSVSEVRGDEAP